MQATYVLRTIAAAVAQLDLPAPIHYAIGTSSIHLGFRGRSDVDRWARHVGLPPATEHVNGEYASVEFYTNERLGWLHARVIVLCVANIGGRQVPAPVGPDPSERRSTPPKAVTGSYVPTNEHDSRQGVPGVWW